MTKERATIEKIAPSVEEAVEEALLELGLSENDVEIEVLDEGAKGVLGIGTREARVRLTVKDEGQEEVSTPTPTEEEIELTDSDLNIVQITEATVLELLEKMNVTAKVSAYLRDNGNHVPNVFIDITGNDLSILIGRKAETLNALEYITRLIVGKEIGHSVHVNIDVEGYRKRREDSLNKLANRMADQAVSSGRTQTLEPMSANERRLIHIALRDNDLVETSSVGEEPRRKVTIIPK